MNRLPANQGVAPNGTNGHPAIAPQQSTLTDQLRALTQVVSQQGKMLNTLCELIAQQSGEMAHMRDALRVLHQREEGIAALSHQLRILSDEHHLEHMLKPLVRRIGIMIDLAGDYLVQFEGPMEGELGTAVELLQAMRDQSIETLGEYSISKLHADPGMEFDGKWMQSGKQTITHAKEENNRVKRTMHCGFARGSRVLRPATVELLKFEDVSGQLF